MSFPREFDSATPLVPMLVTVAVIIVLHWAFNRYRQHLESKVPFDGQIPMPPNSHWLYGHVRTFQKIFNSNRSNFFTDYVDELGRVAFWMGPKPVLVVTHAEDARTVLQAEYYRNLPFFVRKHVQHFLGDKNVGLLQGKQWKRHRSAIYKAVSPVHTLVTAEKPMRSVADALVKSIQSKLHDDGTDFVCLDIESVMKMVTIDVFAKATLSMDLKCCETLAQSPIAVAFSEMVEDMNYRISSILNPVSYFYLLPTQRNRRQERNRVFLRAFLLKLINDRIEDEQAGKALKQDVLTNLLQAHRDDPDSHDEDITDEALNDTLMALLFAGFDTTSITLTFALYLLSQDATVEQICLDEIEQEFAKEEGSSQSMVLKLVYCRAVIKESLRLFPAAGFTNRVLQKPVTLGRTENRGKGFVIPANTRVFVDIATIQRQDRHFPNADRFLPSRWVSRDEGDSSWKERSDVNFDAFLAFSAGGRSCPGQRFAMQEAVIVLATLLKTLKFETSADYKFEPTRITLLQRPKGGLPMRVSQRGSSTGA